MTEEMRTAVGLGSNLGDRLGNLRAAREAILDVSNVKPPIFPRRSMRLNPWIANLERENF